MLLAPKHERRAWLLSTKEFFCECARCRAEGDDMRRFPCCTARCKGYFTAGQQSDTAEQEWTSCKVCQMEPTGTEKLLFLREEQKFIRQVKYLEQVLALG